MWPTEQFEFDTPVQKTQKRLSLLVCNEKKCGYQFFVSDISRVGIWPFWLRLPGAVPNC